jgi:hypothetical protein
MTMQSGDTKVTLEQVESVMKDMDVRDEVWWGNTTVVSVRLKNGWTITKTTACIDPAEYDHSLGFSICMKEIESEIWKMLGWSLNSQINGNLI